MRTITKRTDGERKSHYQVKVRLKGWRLRIGSPARSQPTRLSLLLRTHHIFSFGDFGHDRFGCGGPVVRRGVDGKLLEIFRDGVLTSATLPNTPRRMHGMAGARAFGTTGSP